MPSYVGVNAVCDNLKVTCVVEEVVQRKMAEAGRGLNMSKCRILILPDSLAASSLPGRLNWYKVAGVPTGPEIFS